MNKRIRKSAAGALLLLMTTLGACGEDRQEAENMTGKDQATEMTGSMSEQDRSMFAGGMATEDPQESDVTVTPTAAPTAEAVSDDAVEEQCPAAIANARTDVTYGEYTHDTYYSKTCGMERGYSILLPADYSEDKKYPVLYLLHGIFGDEFSFTNEPGNRIKEIVGNMVADGKMDDLIVVFPNMYATSDPEQKPAFDWESCLPYDNFINELTNDLMPYIESHYSVLTGREHTYLAGFSMGGRETIYITLQRPELFGYVCAISAAPGVVYAKDAYMEHQGQLKEEEMCFAADAIRPDVFILCCGTKDSVVGNFPRSYHEIFAANGTEHIWYEIPNADHDNNAIRSGIYNLLKQVGCAQK